MLDTIMKTRTALSALIFFTGLTMTCFAGDDQTLRDLDAQWSKAVGAKDVDKTMSFYSDDATALPPNAPIATTKEAIRKIWKEFMEAPGFAISWKATKVEIAKSGEIGFISGTYAAMINDASGKAMKEQGKYVEIWEKKGGTWKCGVDIWNSDSPMAPAEKK